MKEYTITMSFSVEAEKSKLEKIQQFADELTQKILDDSDLAYSDDIEIVDITIDDIQDHNDYDYDDEDEDFANYDNDDEDY